MHLDLDVSGVEYNDIDFDDDADFGSQSSQKENKNPDSEVKSKISQPPKGWDSLGAGDGPQVVIPQIEVDSSKLPLIENEDKEKVLRMFWLDAYEDQYKKPGKLGQTLARGSKKIKVNVHKKRHMGAIGFGP